MPREVITIQCGQCGNQVGWKFWEMALEEHAFCNYSGAFQFSMSSFFRNVDIRFKPPVEIPVANGKSRICALEARAVLVDMEEGVVNQVLKGPLSSLFQSRQCITGVSGSGNNWAHGHDVYGPQYGEAIVEKIQSEAEKCESLQSFLMLHSIGGGTGSGLGSYIMEALNDNFPEVHRISAPIFPSKDDDVVTSPYNSLLSVKSLIEHADCVLPIENQALCDILEKVEAHNEKRFGSSKSRQHPLGKAFDGMNAIVANLLLHLTSSVRFEGSLNVDLDEITTNLVPFPRLHFLMSSLSPLCTWRPTVNGPSQQNAMQRTSAINQLFADVFSSKNQLVRSSPLAGTYLGSAFLLRGSHCNISDLSHNLSLMRQRMSMIPWNPEGVKFGHCHRPPLHAPRALLCLANNSCVRHQFARIKACFEKLFRKRVYVHHYAEYMDLGMFEVSLEALEDLIQEYASHDVANVLQ